MIADYTAETKIVIFQSLSERQGDKWRSSSNCDQITAKMMHFNGVNSEITGHKFTKFVNDVAGLLPCIF